MRAWCLAIACEKLVALSHVGGHGVITLALEAQQLLLVLHLVELATVRALVVASGAVPNFLVPDVRRLGNFT